jgi:release factor glutamine methyltransferase
VTTGPFFVVPPHEYWVIVQEVLIQEADIRANRTSIEEAGADWAAAFISDPASRAKVIRRFDKIVESRTAGHPLQYATGFQVFLDHRYKVGPGVLIPRPETEILVETVVDKLRTKGIGSKIFGAEVGVGSGAISIEILATLPEAAMVGTDVSPQALEYAETNTERILGVGAMPTRLHLLKSMDREPVLQPIAWHLAQELNPNRTKLDFLVSNPPYLAKDDEIARDVLENEPREALFADPIKGEDDCRFYREFAEQAGSLLKPQGFIAMEVPHNRANKIRKLFEDIPRNRWKIDLLLDLTGRPRVMICEWTN